MMAFPEVLRPDILNILGFLKRKKNQGICKGIMVYTNNRYDSKWVNMIIRYIEDSLGGGIFDRTILAFKLNGQVQEPCRTTSDKKLSDFIACCKLHKIYNYVILMTQDFQKCMKITYITGQ